MARVLWAEVMGLFHSDAMFFPCPIQLCIPASEELGSCLPGGKGKQPYPTVDSKAPHHQNKHTTVLIAMESSILLSGIGTD